VYGWRLSLRLPNTLLPFRTALAVGSYLKSRLARRKVVFATPPPDSMGP
jgi:hypothetical protein